ncbi:hypothetical protein niasHT_036702 [Heterodera trifolii]|uniref:Uncharacterized protein n=1 Tax=Heterodera trifolii TaxID=157864 RepID=A0ABD2HV25_9BILA
MQFSVTLTIFGIFFSLSFLANCRHLPNQNLNMQQQWKSLLLPQFMIRIIEREQQMATIFEAEQQKKLAHIIDKGQNAEIEKVPSSANDILRPCYFSPVQCLLRSPGQQRSFETHIGDDKLSEFVAQNSPNDQNANVDQRQMAKQRTERQIAQFLNRKQRQTQNKLGLQQKHQPEISTFRHELFRNLWRN